MKRLLPLLLLCATAVADEPRPQYRLQHFAIDGSPKWGVAVHGSHFGQVTDGCIYDCAGSALVTEDPWVYGNDLSHNMLVGKRPGSGQRMTSENGGRAAGDKVSGDHWHNRVGLGLASAMNRITGNRIYGMNDGIGLAGIVPQSSYYPAERGVCTCAGISDPNAVNFRYTPYRYPFWFDTSDNRVWGCLRGIETWIANSYPVEVSPDRYSQGRANRNWTEQPDPHADAKMFPDLSIVHTRTATDLEDQVHTATYGWRILGDWESSGTVGIAYKNAYERGAVHTDAEIRGVTYAYRTVRSGNVTELRGCTFETPVVLYEPLGYDAHDSGATRSIRFRDCEFLKPAGFVFARYEPQFSMTKLLPIKKNRPDYRTLIAAEYVIEPYSDGRVLRLYHPERRPTFALPPVDANTSYGDWPKGVNTHQQLIQLGKAVMGRVAPDDAVLEPEFGQYYVETVSDDD